ncbi:phosphonate metabolism protein/1,5-bisphosphokinase (PRPP-forming) PhnN [Mesorhizobium sp. M0923]|uniref:phosphonate metabolism protein/1,5-bisphosphokinase (PRPP-forming) PhnN n=1 Tax=unclassified Mesorhizobium TaxID=325217 RepID=UPI0003CFA50C|nr:phosphonate metabolism protein/1,5-bisphosphokinase (PRPP-forming) PhnN [Mesorhizobium sp. L48C026A00]ESZ05477.1 phosphonate ABC transporter ATP-binding protein [Mesorhizobium sp. L48C026A00]
MMSRQGRLILVVGPSGVGKDTLIDYARSRLRSDLRVHFVRRVISRQIAVGENHEPVDNDEFQRRVLEGAFALHWQANGLSYGIPSDIDEWLKRGDVVVVNGSRAILSEARERYPQLLVVNVTAPMDVLAKRLVERGRENLMSIKQRLIRNEQQSVQGGDVLHIDNSGSLEDGGEALTRILLSIQNSAKACGAKC